MVPCEHSYGKFRRCARCGEVKDGYEVAYTVNWSANTPPLTLNYTATYTNTHIRCWDAGWESRNANWGDPVPTVSEIRRQRNAESRRRSRAVIAKLARETPRVAAPTKRPPRIVARARSTI